MKKIEISSFLDFQFVSAPSFSPDGEYAAFLLQTPDLEGNRYAGDIYLLHCGSAAVSRLTAEGTIKSFFWTPEGNLLYAPGQKEKTPDAEEAKTFPWYEVSPLTGDPRKAFSLPFSARSLTPVDSDRYIVTASCPIAPDENREDKDYQAVEEAPFWFNGVGFTAGKRSRLYLFNRASGELNPITSPLFDAASHSLRGTKLLIKGQEWQGAKRADEYDGCYLYDLETGEMRCVLPAGTIRSGAMAFWSEDTALLAASDDKRYGTMQYFSFYTLDLNTGVLNLLAEYDASIGYGSVASDSRLGGGTACRYEDDTFYFITTIQGNSYLRAIGPSGAISEYLTPEGSCDSFDVCNGKLLVCGMYGGQLPELYLNGQQVTDFNKTWMAEHTVCPMQRHNVTDANGHTVEGWVMEPAGYQPGTKYPGILHIHGGPRTAFGQVYHHEMQVWANVGYFVFFCNPHGSDGMGNDFGDIAGKYGTIDYENLMQFTDSVLAAFPDIDKTRVGVTGGSYGGFMTNWIIGHTDRFRAAVSQRSIANWIAFEHTSDIGPSFTLSSHRATTRTNVEALWNFSPLKYAHNCQTPTLFIHSDKDYRCWMVEGISMFTALKTNGCEARLCLFKDENHDLSRNGKPRSRIQRMEEILNWMDRHLKQ